jgi:two-component system, OmpR family, response regulator
VDVTVVRWPREAALRDRLAGESRARLLVVDDGSAPPLVTDLLEDWVWSSADQSETRARMETLAHRASSSRSGPPTLDDDGVLRHHALWVPLPPVEGRLARVLLDRLGAVVSRDALARAGWPDGAPGRNALDVHVLRLRRRLATVDLAIRTVRSRGYLLEAVEPAPDGPAAPYPGRAVALNGS